MDTAAGVVSVRHCRSNVVTASLEAVDFLLPVCNGDLLEISARPVFNSRRSMDVEVNVFAQSLSNAEKRLAATSIFTFVSLDKTYRPQDVPPLTIDTPAQRARFELGARRYQQRKTAREQAKAAEDDPSETSPVGPREKPGTST
jgi:acyl-coenzyme A thioesterase 7